MELTVTKPPINKVIRTRFPKNTVIRQALQNPIQSIRKLNDQSLYNFIRCFWAEVSNDEFKPNWHIKYICQELEQIAQQVGQKKPKQHDLIINIPPGTTKTITVSIMFPVWCWTKWYWMRFITASYSSDLSLESAEYSRDLIRSDKFKAIYPELDIKDDKDQKSNFKVVKKYWEYPGQAPRLLYGGNRFSTSVGGTLTGFHGHINIVDDALNPKQACSEKELQTANYWMDHTLSTRKTDKASTVQILVMQRLHQNDPAGHILEKNKKNVRLISIPGEIRSYRSQVKPDNLISYYKDELLDPIRMPWTVLQDLEADLGQYGYAGQIGQKPTPPGGGMFKVDHFTTTTTMPDPHNVIETVRYWDKAGSEGAGAYTVGVKMCQLVNKKFLVMDVKRGQWSSEERERIIKQTAVADGPLCTVVVEQEPGSGGKESAEGTIRNLAGYSCYADRPTGDKVFRADPYSVQVNNGNVQVLHSDWNHDFIEEHRYFPVGTYKDQVDATSGAFARLTATNNFFILKRRQH